MSNWVESWTDLHKPGARRCELLKKTVDLLRNITHG
uniref:Uncharacterized protein n=1 Tax=Anguilla anguilla TaxID=7936 RepID=A0A0E9PLA0_ANGAN